MKLIVHRPQDSGATLEFTFIARASGCQPLAITISYMSARLLRRDYEDGPLVETGHHWSAVDMSGNNTMERPEPDFEALEDAKRLFWQHVSFDL